MPLKPADQQRILRVINNHRTYSLKITGPLTVEQVPYLFGVSGFLSDAIALNSAIRLNDFPEDGLSWSVSGWRAGLINVLLNKEFFEKFFIPNYKVLSEIRCKSDALDKKSSESELASMSISVKWFDFLEMFHPEMIQLILELPELFSLLLEVGDDDQKKYPNFSSDSVNVQVFINSVRACGIERIRPFLLSKSPDIVSLMSQSEFMSAFFINRAFGQDLVENTDALILASSSSSAVYIFSQNLPSLLKLMRDPRFRLTDCLDVLSRYHPRMIFVTERTDQSIRGIDIALDFLDQELVRFDTEFTPREFFRIMVYMPQNKCGLLCSDRLKQLIRDGKITSLHISNMTDAHVNAMTYEDENAAAAIAERSRLDTGATTGAVGGDIASVVDTQSTAADAIVIPRTNEILMSLIERDILTMEQFLAMGQNVELLQDRWCLELLKDSNTVGLFVRMGDHVANILIDRNIRPLLEGAMIRAELSLTAEEIFSISPHAARLLANLDIQKLIKQQHLTVRQVLPMSEGLAAIFDTPGLCRRAAGQESQVLASLLSLERDPDSIDNLLAYDKTGIRAFLLDPQLSLLRLRAFSPPYLDRGYYAFWAASSEVWGGRRPFRTDAEVLAAARHFLHPDPIVPDFVHERCVIS